MKKICLIFSLAVMTFLIFPGCSYLPWEVARKNIENTKRLRVGMTKKQVLEIMGEPLRDEVFCTPDVWFYYREMIWGDGLTAEEECIPLVFENGRLAGWGNRFYTEYRSAGVRNARDISLVGKELPQEQSAPQKIGPSRGFATPTVVGTPSAASLGGR